MEVTLFEDELRQRPRDQTEQAAASDSMQYAQKQCTRGELLD
jgi:hypothetical protein